MQGARYTSPQPNQGNPVTFIRDVEHQREQEAREYRQNKNICLGVSCLAIAWVCLVCCLGVILPLAVGLGVYYSLDY